MRSVKNNFLKKFLIIFFAFLSLLFIFSRPITTYAYSGSTKYPSPFIPSGGNNKGDGFCNTTAIYRMMAFKVKSPEDAASKGYFSVDDNKKISFKRNGNVYFADDYLETNNSGKSNWFYWDSTWTDTEAARTPVYVQSGAKSFRVMVNGYNSKDAKDLVKAVDPKLHDLHYDEHHDNLGAFFKALEEYDNWASKTDKLADELPGVSPGDSYVIVIEELKVIKDNGRFYAFTYGNWMKANSAVRAHYNASPYYTDYFNNPTHWLRQGDIPPFKAEGYKFANANLDKKAAYSLYGDIRGTTNDSAAGNIHVQYQGEPNTVDGEFKVAGTVIKKGTDDNGKYIESGDEDSNYWFNPKDSTWYPSNEWKVLSRVADKGIIYKTDSGYVNIYADYYSLNIDDKCKVKTLVNKFNSLSGFSIKWGNQVLTSSYTGYDTNVGVEIKPKKLNGKTNTSAVMDKVVDESTDFSSYSNRVSNSSESALNLPILKLIKDTTNKARKVSSSDVINGAKLLKDKKLGVAVEFSAKSDKVTSHKVTINIDETGHVTSASETWNDTYPIANHISCTLNKKAVAFTVVPNSARDDLAMSSAVEGSESAGKALAGLIGFGSSMANGTNCGGNKIGLGATTSTPVDGYTVYEVIIEEPAPTPDKGALSLDSYMLNKYFEDVIQTSSALAGDRIWWQLNKDFTIIKENYNIGTNCPRGCWVYPTGYTGKQEDWNIEWHDASSGTTHVDWDNSMRQSYFPNMETGVWSHSNRIDLAGWASEDTERWGTPSGYIVDYGFNLVRAASGDKRSISGISYPNYADRDPSNLLKIKDQFGVVPSTVYNGGAKTRKPDKTDGSRLATTTERLYMKSRFTLYHGSGFSLKSNTHYHYEEGHWGSTTVSVGNPPTSVSVPVWVVDKSEVNITYYTFPSKMPSGYLKNNTWSSNTLEYSWTNSYYKYKSTTIPNGLNNVLGSTLTAHKAISNASKTKIESGHVDGTNEYRFANVRYNGVTLSFYPEVKMVYKLGGTTWSQVKAAEYKTIYTIGEYLRKTQSSSLYLFKLNGNGDGSITGTTYSDAMQGGSNTLGNTNVMIPAGSDVNVAADMNGINVDLYAYALDIIDKSVDSPSFKNSATTTKNYKSIVQSNENVYQKWMGASNVEILKNHFLDWTNKILDVENFGADFELKVNGSTKSENFGATIGHIDRNTTITEDGVYQLVVENGSLQTSKGDYNKMITQIAADYECSEAEAKAIWNASGIHTAILNAIESSTSNFNKSGVCSYNPSWTSKLGNSTNWYDEKTYTFVVRRFTNLDNKFCDIIASDKIDYNLAPNGELNDKQNANAGTTSNANWTVTIYFDNDKSTEVNNYLLDSGTYYTPNTGTSTSGSSNFVTANSSHTILINKAPVKNADFLIPASSTSDFGY